MINYGMVRKYETRFPMTYDFLYERYVIQGLRQKDIAKELGCTQPLVTLRLKQLGIPSPIKAHRKTVRGYVHVWAPDHPAAYSNGYVPEHRLVMEKALGRSIAPNEVIHHMNHDRADNRPENLMVLTRGEHSAHHLRERRK